MCGQAQEDLPGALGACQAGLKIVQRLVDFDPSNVEWQNDLLTSHTHLAAIAFAKGDKKTARPWPSAKS